VIISEIVEGVDPTSSATIVTIPDRRAAICDAIASAGAGDVVVIAGKGHETVQEFADRTIEFDDRVVARNCLETHG
jgi:UDP-N-acetylmuramoyl-L-alanyl-D-glutamate--2,6-diaminopimelate ligase